MNSDDFLNLMINTREAWFSGKLSPVSSKHMEIADKNEHLPIHEFMGDFSGMQMKLKDVPAIRGEWIYGFDDEKSPHLLLTSYRFFIRGKRSKSFDIYDLKDMSSCQESGWWTKTVKVILKSGYTYTYKGLDSSISLEYIMLAISRANDQLKSEPVMDTPELNDGFVFISYTKNDYNKIKPYLDHFDKVGIKYWFDQGIPGGADWHNVIESKIRSCHRVVAFLSDEAIQSKWVNREIKYADIKNIAITPVKMDKGDLINGLDLILMQYQLVDFNSPNCLNEILRSLE
ncbi:toll/interleukin-1 receptor domain-containing protein [Winogradskyella sp. DF17]|uniref:Toll/interleukin-1 receptor domain-containing protein n=1 Tax=Winogradskyella pelagia TaxID=2819984 RepID=A0ABS3T425_9FLAO|nr:toll/interleukin-1 receptor domain-containing protein [Winogradskyella sp. DF17]MBO3117492.1 toll/interleukin-1 receptor domain-containing protein [Winogradskyella sp. DF17]